jgi:hypothetical protein
MNPAVTPELFSTTREKPVPGAIATADRVHLMVAGCGSSNLGHLEWAQDI